MDAGMDGNNLWKNKERKTYAFAANRDRYQSGWTSDSRRYSSVPPKTVLESNTSYKFAEHTFDHGQKGSYNASHVEAQALCRVQEDSALLVSRPMCNSCKKFVEYLAQSKRVTVHVGTPDGIQRFSGGGSSRVDSASGVTVTRIEWSMSYDGRQSILHLRHPSGEETELSVWGNSEQGPIAMAMEYHQHSDGITERSTYYQNKGTVVETLNIGDTEHEAGTRIGPSNGLQDSLNRGKWGKVPKKFLG